MAKELSQSVSNALRLMECFADAEELGITELAAETGVGKTVAARLVGSLVEYGYLRQNPKTRKYRLGLKLVFWGTLVRERNEIVQVAEPYLKALSQEFQLTAHLAVLDRYAARIISKVASGPMIYMDSRVGSTLPTHACATGKCLLASSSPEFVEEFLEAWPLTRLTAQTITDRTDLSRELEAIRAQGYAWDNEESNIGLSCVAIPILDAGGSVVAAMSLSGQTQFVKANQGTILRRLRAAAGELSTRM